MPFNSYLFIFAFLPLAVISFFLAGRFSKRAADVVLVLFSMAFYAYGGWRSLLVVAVDICLNALIVRYLKKHRCRLLLIFGIVINCAVILFFRTFVGVLGISFISFQLIAFIIEMYKGSDICPKLPGRSWLLDYLAYVLYFPKIIAGPLASPSDFMDKLRDENRYRLNADNLAQGFMLFTIGAFKKVMIADTFAKTVSWGFSHFDSATSMDWVFVIFAYTFQIYFDFSGYCDMAGGVSSMLNLELPINFDSPYKALSIPDFWKRWHITLTDFLRKNIYYPLGGNRKGTARTCLNIMIVFLASGIWHGRSLTFVLWGLLHGLLSVLYRLSSKWYDRLHPALRWMMTFAAVSLLWLLFRSDSISQWLSIIKKIVLIENLNVSEELARSVFLVETEPLLNFLGLKFLNYRPIRAMIAFFAVTLAVCLGSERAYGKEQKYNIVMIVLITVMFVTVVISLGGESTFIYQRF